MDKKKEQIKQKNLDLSNISGTLHQTEKAKPKNFTFQDDTDLTQMDHMQCGNASSLLC